MAAKAQNFVQFCNEQGIVDPLVDILALDSPSGKVRSRRAYERQRERLGAQSRRYWDALEEYQQLVDTGEIVDPTGDRKPRVPAAPEPIDESNPPNIVIALRREVERHPRSKRYRLALEQAEAEWRSEGSVVKKL